MNINEFIKNIAEQYEDTDFELFTPETKFKELKEWGSLIALSLIAALDCEYDVAIKAEDIKNSNTIQDLYNIVISRK